MDTEAAAQVGTPAMKEAPRRRHRHPGVEIGILVLAVIAGAAAAYLWFGRSNGPPAPVAAAPPAVTVSLPAVRTVANRTGFLGQFSAVDEVELRAQVGGILTEIRFQDGQIVHKGDILFVIDARPYEIKLQMAVATFRSAQARLTLAKAELWRAQQLRQTSFGTAETVDQRVADQDADAAALETASNAVQDAQLDLEYCQVKAPFTGRISAHRVSVGSLVSGSRAGSSPTTLLTTLVSLDPIHLDFDMSENDFLDYARAHPNGAVGGEVDLRLSDEDRDSRHGVLDFIDNALDRSSGTIHARATVPNADMFLVPGAFARLSLVTGAPAPALLVPDSAVLLDQSQHIVMTVAADGTVVPKTVRVGGLSDGMRIIRDGIAPTDKIIVDGLARAMPGAKVAPDLRPLPAPPAGG